MQINWIKRGNNYFLEKNRLIYISGFFRAQKSVWQAIYHLLKAIKSIVTKRSLKCLDFRNFITLCG